MLNNNVFPINETVSESKTERNKVLDNINFDVVTANTMYLQNTEKLKEILENHIDKLRKMDSGLYRKIVEKKLCDLHTKLYKVDKLLRQINNIFYDVRDTLRE